MSRTPTHAHGIPIDSVSLDQLPQESPLNYDEISKLVGSLYIDANHKINIINEQARALVESLKGRVSDLTEENSRLKEELKRKINDRAQFAQHGNEIEASKNNIGSNKV